MTTKTKKRPKKTLLSTDRGQLPVEITWISATIGRGQIKTAIIGQNITCLCMWNGKDVAVVLPTDASTKMMTDAIFVLAHEVNSLRSQLNGS